jgi:hypothetical protein
MTQEIQPSPVGFVPSDIHLALSEFNQAHRLMMRYFEPAVKCSFPGDLTRDQYEQICEVMYEIDSSDTADTLIRNAKEAFGRYAYKRSLISF